MSGARFQASIDKMLGSIGRSFGRPYAVYRITADFPGGWLRLAQSMAVLRNRASGRGLEQNQTTERTLWYLLAGDLSRFRLGDVFVASDGPYAPGQSYGAGATSVPGTNEIDGFAFAWHAPVQPPYGARLDRLVGIYRPELTPGAAADGSTRWNTTHDGDTLHVVMPAAAEGDQTDTDTKAGTEAQVEAPVAAKADEPQSIVTLFDQHEGEFITLQQRSAEGLVLMVNGEVVYRQHRKVRSTAKADKPAREPKAPKTEPEGKYKLIVDLCCRETGASPQELHEATGWTGAPWKWLLTNPKNTGLAQKYGYDFVASKDGRNVRYMLVKQEAQQAEAA